MERSTTPSAVFTSGGVLIMTKGKWLERGLVIGPNLVLVTSAKDYARVCKELKVPTDQFPFLDGFAIGQVRTLINDKGQYCCIVSIDPAKFDSRRKVYSALTHEAVHVWQQAAEQIGEDKPSLEFEAYSIQRIAEVLWDEYDRQRPNKRNKA